MGTSTNRTFTANKPQQKKMNPQLCVFLLAVGLSQVAAWLPQPLPEHSLLKLMLDTRDLRQDDPSHSMQCFDYYNPILSDLSEQYKLDFQKCLDVAANGRNDVKDKTQGSRDEINGAATNACQALKTCGEKTAPEDFFQCYSTTGGENAVNMYAISADSSEQLAKVEEEYRLITDNMYVCTNKTNRVYVESSIEVNNELRGCLTGNPIPSEVPSTQGPTTEQPSTSSDPEDPSTAAPEDPSTAAPEDPSTAAPEDPSTAAPEEPSTSNTEPNTEEPSTEEPKTEEPNTEEPSTDDPDTKEQAPEEDLKQVINNLKKWLKRH